MSLGYSLLAFFCGLSIGSFNMFLIYKLYKMVFKLAFEEAPTKRNKRKLVLAFLLKVGFFFTSCYVLIAVLKLHPWWFLGGIILSIAGGVFVMYKKTR